MQVFHGNYAEEMSKLAAEVNRRHKVHENLEQINQKELQ